MPNRFAILMLRCAGIALLLAALGGCSSLPKIDRAAIASEAIEASNSTTLGRLAKAAPPDFRKSRRVLMIVPPWILSARCLIGQQLVATRPRHQRNGCHGARA